MQSTMQLLEKALSIQTAAGWANKLNITRQTFTNAKKAHRLSPALAGNLAIELGEPPEEWIAIAAIEAEKESPLLERLRKSQPSWRKRCPKNNSRTRNNRVFLFETRRIGLGNTVNGTLNDRRMNIHERRQTM